MSLNDGSQSRLIPNIRHPARQLRVPNSGVSTDDLVVGHSPVDQSIQTTEVEVSFRALDCIPFPATSPIINQLFHSLQNQN